MANVWFKLDRRRRRVAVENVLASGIRTDRDAADQLARSSARHFSAVVVETLKSHQYLAGDAWRDRVELSIHPSVLEVLEDSERGLLVAACHLGNWEIGAQVLSTWKPVLGAARAMSNPYVHRLMTERKPKFRFRLTTEWFGDPKRFIATLKRGEALALLFDLDARGRGLAVDFFGRPAATHTTVPMLHLVTKAPMCLGCCLRKGPGRFEIVTSELIEHRPTGSKEDDVRAILTRLNRELEELIRAHPDQFIWGHSRWKHGHWRPGLAGVRRGESIPKEVHPHEDTTPGSAV